MGYIYKIINKVNGKIYIGKTTRDIESRFAEHKKKAQEYPNRYLYDAMNHYGYENFTISEIEECPDEMLDEKEKYWIKQYQSNQHNIGYNLTDGGEGGNTWKNNPHKIETGEKIRQAHIGEDYIPITKENLQQDIKDGMLGRDMMKKYHCSSVTLANRMREYFGKSLKEIRPTKNSGQFKKKELPEEEFYQDIKNNILTNKEILEKYNLGETTFYNKCKELFHQTPREIRGLKRGRK